MTRAAKHITPHANGALGGVPHILIMLLVYVIARAGVKFGINFMVARAAILSLSLQRVEISLPLVLSQVNTIASFVKENI